MAVISKDHTYPAKGIFKYFSEENIERLQSIMYPMKAEAGTFLLWEGDLADKMYFIRSGRVKIHKATEEGRDLILSVLQKGDLIMEMGGDDDALFSFGAEVAESAQIGIMQRKDLEVLLYQHGDLAVEFMYLMGLQHRTAQSKFRDLLLYGKPGALASTLIRMSNSYGVESEDGIRIGLKLTNHEIADMIGATRESVNRMLSEWKSEGIVRIDEGKITILQLERLRRICNCADCPAEICRI